ncbi:hypothetical protein JCM3774_002922 [Rhodotorula dairenensis]
MPAATKGSKRNRAAEGPPSPRPSTSAAPAQVPAAAPPSSNLAPARPLSAVAARRAARDAARAAVVPSRASAAPVDDVVPTDQRRLDEQVSTGGDTTMRSESPSTDSTPRASSSDDEARAPLANKRVRVAARYFASNEETAGRRAPTSRPQSSAQSRTPSEAQDDYTPFEEDMDVSTAWESPRATRRRREKPSFIDASCISTFVPRVGENFVVCEARLGGQTEATQGALLFLQAGETLLIRGVCGITPVWGAVTVLNATLRATVPATLPAELDVSHLRDDALHPLFVPNSHPVPPICALGSATRPPVLRTRSGETYAAPTTCSAILFVSDLDTGVEGLERILATGGIGHGLGFSLRKGKMPAYGSIGRMGRTWSLLVEPEPSYTRLREDEHWQAALQTHLPPSPFGATSPEVDWRDDALVALVEGPKRAGKSTFAKLLLHELLDRYEAVAYLDTDLGQAEFTAPGFVSLTVLRRPVLGPSFTHLRDPLASHFLGSTSPAADPAEYLAACEALLSTYRLEVEFSGGDDGEAVARPGRRPKGRLAGDRSGPAKGRDRVPLVVNTSGWNKGLGADILVRLKELARPTHVFAFTELSAECGSGPPPPSPLGAPHRQIPLPAAFPSPLESKWTPADLRTLALVSYFYGTGRGEGQLPQWETARPLVARPVRPCHWGIGQPRVTGVHVAGNGDIRYEHVLHALNGSIVALVADMQPAFDPLRPFPYAPRAPLPSPTSSRAIGLAIVHSVAPAAETLYLLAPAKSSSSEPEALALVKGALDTPVALMCDFTASADEVDAGLAGVDWAEVPYLSVETGEAVGRRRVRRNLMRKGQA